MKGKYTVFIILAIILVAIGATFYFVMQFFEDNPTQPQPIGYSTGIIVEMNDSSILVVSDLSEEEARNLSVEEATDTGKNATWFSLTMDQRNQLKLYDEVKVGYETLDESFPAQGTAKTVEKLNE
ncbi:YobA family protein [Psychrobacillus sp. NPDC058041]|uniref:YobA family protein n=1 Tax=Psychrobacillus sp. NPDC058041 TaxID=3346310 RepID=UPI0036DBC36B